MKITLSFEQSISDDVSVIVDALRASTTMTVALDNFKRVIPCFTPEEAFELKEKTGGVIAGERGGKQIEGFDIGNTPVGISNYKTKKDTLILTTSNGTRILENMTSKVIVGSLINARVIGEKINEIATQHVDIVMAGVKGEFAIEDFLAAGEIIHQICKNLDDYELSEYAQSSVLASRDYECLTESFLNSRSGKRLIELGYKNDVEFCCKKNISENIGIYNNNELTLYI